MPAPKEIIKLVERFHEHIEDYKSGKYKEEQVCAEFILPMFEVLGWDIYNRDGNSEAYKDVIHHDSIKMGVATKAPDYCFRVGGVRKFFLEAKKPSVSIKDEPHPAYQLRRYAWSAKLPLGIVTDFEEFAVYDCRAKPSKSDKATTARLMYFKCDEYVKRWDEIAGIFSKDAIFKGSFDKYAEGSKGRRGTASVDDAFLEEIERWRKLLAQGIAQRNKLGVRELNFAVQAIIDRIIFLRICEDQSFESYGRFMALQNGPHVYERLLEMFRHADQRYNSGLFHFEQERGRATPPDTLTPKLKIDDDVLRDIFKNLYYPQSPYEFSVIPTEILGQAYERFLGRVIHLTSTRRAVIEEKPEVRKAGGVYYTPTYIVDYIVKNTVGKLLEGKSPKEAAKLKILDPACGSGSFLIGAYDLLRKWHLDWYVKHDPEKWAKGKSPALYKVRKDEWVLTFAEQRRILTDNLHGVDIDPQAVEVTKLSLLLKLLEGLTQHEMFRQHALPDLGTNIKCGNSLIGPDFYEGKQMSFLDDEERMRMNVFDWDREFSDIMKSGGFDAVIGNPPYVRIQTTKSEDISYYDSTYQSAIGNYDIYCIFAEKGTRLLKTTGTLGYILPHRFFKTAYGEGLRSYIVEKSNLQKIVDFNGYMVFEQASINTCIMILGKNDQKKFFFAQARFYNKSQDEVAAILSNLSDSDNSTIDLVAGNIPLKTLSSNPWVFIWKHEEPIWAKLNSTRFRLGDVTTHIYQGLKTSADGIYIGTIEESRRNLAKMNFGAEKTSCWIENDILKPLIKGGHMSRYLVGDTSMRILFPYDKGKLIAEDHMKKRFPKAWAYLLDHKQYLEEREDGKMKGASWYGYGRSQALDIMHHTKIITPDYYADASYCLDEKGQYYFCGGGAGGYGIRIKSEYSPKYILGLLNSKLLDWYLHKITIRAYQTAYMYVKKYIERIPIRTSHDPTRLDKSQYDLMIKLVDERVELQRKLSVTQLEHDRMTIERQIAATDQQIDKLVYALYGLTEEEIRIVEGVNNNKK